jgi:DUF4097 and DUF4098 domain-containing protein YvlB
VYTDARHYTAGDARISQQVDKLDINWIDGTVYVEYYNGSDIRLSETCTRELTKDQQLHWYLDGKTLRVQYVASAVRISDGLDKQLTVLLPNDLRLKDAHIAVASAQVEADGLNARKIKIDSASGQVALRQLGEAEEIEVNTASGAVAVAVENAELLKVNSASGAVIVDALYAEEAKLTTVSGNITLQLANAPDRIKADSVSGAVRFILPGSMGFTADVDSLSGRVGGSLPLDRDDDDYRYGNGRCRIEVDTVSGNVTFDENTAGEGHQL